MDHLFSFWICCGGGGGLSSLFRVQVDGDDQTVQTQDFSENEDQNHTDEQSGLLGSTTDTGITDDTDGETGGQTGESYSQTSTEMDEALVQRVLRGRIQRTGDKDSNDQTVDGNDTRHDNGNDGLHDQLRPHHRHGGNTGTGFRRSIGGSEGAENDRSSCSHDTEEGSVDGVFLWQGHL